VLVWSEAWNAEGEKGETNYCLDHTLIKLRVPLVNCEAGGRRLAKKSIIEHREKTFTYSFLSKTEQFRSRISKKLLAAPLAHE
jgi:hypothetical protein